MNTGFIEALARSFEDHETDVCAVDLGPSENLPRQILTYAQVKQKSAALTAQIQSRFHDGPYRPVIGILARNSSDWLAADLACLFSGCTALPLPLAFSRAQAVHLAERCNGFLVDSTGSKMLENKWGLTLARDCVIDLGQVSTGGSSDWPTPPPDDWVCKVIHTSGTTSRPKGVRIKASAITAVLKSLKEGIPEDAHKRYLSAVPLSLLLEQVTAAYMPLLIGGAVHFLPEQTPLLGEPSSVNNSIIGPTAHPLMKSPMFPTEISLRYSKPLVMVSVPFTLSRYSKCEGGKVLPLVP